MNSFPVDVDSYDDLNKGENEEDNLNEDENEINQDSETLEDEAIHSAGPVLDSELKEPFIGTSSKNLKQTDIICYQDDFIPKYYDNIQKVQVHQYIQKKLNMVDLWDILNNEMKLTDGRVYDVNNIKNLIKHWAKGRPSGKCLKAYNEKSGGSKIHKENVYEKDLEKSNENECRCVIINYM
ncbi:hypothetical protein C1645_833075 [Glomus cerebriforme]|uniref:Uncharacterized protein n=1 Tax=Glomus cerebriforme TaxID=658196 RepID=A0A397SI96_9GLOM|nr:hypothetical protein C1645_833075 [Glomus cerebriforme]